MIRRSKIDILFLQEVDKLFMEELGKYFGQEYLIHSRVKSQSIIMIRRAMVKGPDLTEEMMKKVPDLKDKLNWNNDSDFMIIDKMILISAHLSSKKAKNPDQTQLAFEHLIKLKETFKDFHLLVGADANNPEFTNK